MLAQTALLQFIRRVDPLTTAGVAIDSTNVHSAAGDVYTAQQRLDHYNKARKAVLDEMRKLPKSEFLKRASGFIISEAITFAAGAATKPTNFMALTDDETGIVVGSAFVRLRTATPSTDPSFAQDTTTKFVSLIGSQFKDPLAALAGTGTISYIGATDLTLANVTTATAIEEKFLENDIPHLVDVAVNIANQEAQVVP